MRFLKKLYSLLILSVGFLTATTAFSQEAPEEYPEIRQIIPQFDGFRAVSDQFILSNIQMEPGMNYNPALIDQSIRALYASGHFEFVEVRVENAPADKVDVFFELVSKYTIERIRFNGNERFSDSRLARRAEVEDGTDLRSGDALDEYKISLAVEALTAYYVKKGYPDAVVDYRITRNPQTGYAVVDIDIEEGGDLRIDDIIFKGNKAFKDKKLRKELEIKRNNFFSWISGAGKFDEKQFKKDIESLRKFYRNNGFLDSVIDEELIEFDFFKEDEVNIIITVSEGELYFLGNVSVENNTVFTNDELLIDLPLKDDQRFSPEKVDNAAQSIREYYTSRGYLDTIVRAERVPNIESRRIDVVFRVRESERFYLDSILVEGNNKTKAVVIIRELALRPGDVFDRQRMDVSQARLKNTSYFEDVRLSPEPTNIPGRKDLGIMVREGRTGNFTVGAGFGSVESAVVYFEITQGNFDLFNWRSGFQGDGQKFRFRTSLGTNSNQIVVSFIEPWLFEQRLEFGVELYRSETDYNSADYNELRTGFELFLRRRLFELVEARLSYRLELVEIFDVDRNPFTNPANPNDPRNTIENPDGSLSNDGIADVFQAAEGKDLVSKVGLTFLRDNRNSLIFTRSGNRSSLLSEVAGLGGDVNYYKFEAKTAQFIPTFDTLEQSFSIVARTGTVTPWGQSMEVPFYDRFYLGGPNTLRGFDYREVGPRDPDDDDESVGGNSYSMVSLEYMFRVAEPLALVVFYDWGYVNTDEFDFSMSDYADNWGVGARILLMGSPLQLDLGIPITSPEGVGGGTQFNFSFGTRF